MQSLQPQRKLPQQRLSDKAFFLSFPMHYNNWERSIHWPRPEHLPSQVFVDRYFTNWKVTRFCCYVIRSLKLLKNELCQSQTGTNTVCFCQGATNQASYISQGKKIMPPSHFRERKRILSWWNIAVFFCTAVKTFLFFPLKTMVKEQTKEKKVTIEAMF